MQHTANGLAASDNFEERFYAFLPRYRQAPGLTLTFAEFDQPIDSADADFDFAVRIFERICGRLNTTREFIVLMGSDTLSYIGAALAFLLHDRDVSVIVTGSMQPLEDPDTDAKRNLNHALSVLCESNVAGVSVIFGGKQMPAARCKKLFAMTSEAMVDTRSLPVSESVKPCKANLPKWASITPCDVDIRCLRAQPSLSSLALSHCVQGQPDAVIVESYGSGTVPSSSSPFAAVIRECRAKHIPVFVISQCLRTPVNVNAYASSSWLADEGVVACGDMHFEALYAKLWYLLSLGCRGDELKTATQINLCGELS